MNQFYKVIWNRTLGRYVVTSELAKNQAKSKSHVAGSRSRLAKFSLSAACALALVSGLGAGNALAAVNLSHTQDTYRNGPNSYVKEHTEMTITGSDSAITKDGKTIQLPNIEIDTFTNNNSDPKFTSVGVAVGQGSSIDLVPDSDLKATGNSAIAMGPDAKVKSQGGGIAIGKRAQVSDKDPNQSQRIYDFTIALGNDAKVNGGSMAIGDQSEATQASAMGIGRKAKATGNASIAIGSSAEASATHSASFGAGAIASGQHGLALGTTATASAEGSTALGWNSQATGNLAQAFGTESSATASNSAAIGYLANATAEGGVAIGSHSSAVRGTGSGYDFATKATSTQTSAAWRSSYGAVSVGATDDNGTVTGSRQITGVAAGAEDTDAVNVAQLKNAVSSVNINSEQQINSLHNDINKLGNRINRVGAGAAALAALHPLDFDPDSKVDFAAGYGNYRDANAVAVGAYYRPNEDVMFNVGGSFGGGENMVNAGVSVKLGAGSNHVSTSRVAMAKELKEVRGIVAKQNAQIAQLTAIINSFTGNNLPIDKTELFPDVPENHWAYEAVASLKGANLVKGYPDGEFKGDRMMTRYEFAQIVYNAVQEGKEVSSRLIHEFDPELRYIRVDTIAHDKAGNPTIERVRTVKQ